MMGTHPLEGLKSIRDELGVTAVELAERLGVTRTTYYRFESGKRRAYWDQVDTIADYLGVPHGMLKTIPRGDELRDLVKLGHQRRMTSLELEAAPVLIPRPLMTEGRGLSAITRPYTDEELRQRNLDPAHYEPMIHTEHQPELEALAEAGRVMGADGQTDITELIEEWKDA